MKVITIDDLSQIIKTHSFDQFMSDLISYMKQDFANWLEFEKMPRPAIHVDGGVIEVMPTANKEYYTFKYVNGHPNNPLDNKLTVIGTGQLSKVSNGYPLLFSEMTILTAFRTAATSALATSLLSRADSTTLAIIGTGAQSEFQVLSARLVRKIDTIKYFDTDKHAMEKFRKNIVKRAPELKLVECSSAKEAVHETDIITICTAAKGHFKIIENDWVTSGMHINGLGGDCPGKTELDSEILFRSKLVVEFLPQTKIEGEIQKLSEKEISDVLHAELWEIISNHKAGRTSEEEVTLFQSVGFAIEDFSTLRLVLDLSDKYNIGQNLNIVPNLEDPKNLISLLD